MDLLVDELKKPAGQLYKYSLLGILETAVRASNAYYSDSEFLDRLDVKLLEASPGESGWDIFSLDYRVDAPINTIITPEIIKGYLKVFNLLWRLKRVEHSLNATWVQQTSRKNELYSMKDIRKDLHMCNLLRSEMLHFITNLHSYLQVEVIESEWKRFEINIEQAEDLDKIMDIQKKFIEIIHIRSMLTQDHKELYKDLVEIFELIHKFSQFQDYLYTSALDEYHRRLAESDDMLDEPQLISNEARKQLRVLGERYKKSFESFNEHLSRFEIDQKSLSFRLDFNEYYKQLKERDVFDDHKMNYDIDQLGVDSIDDEDDEEDDEEEEDEEEEIINTQSYHYHHMQRGNNKFA